MPGWAECIGEQLNKGKSIGEAYAFCKGIAENVLRDGAPREWAQPFREGEER